MFFYSSNCVPDATHCKMYIHLDPTITKCIQMSISLRFGCLCSRACEYVLKFSFDSIGSDCRYERMTHILTSNYNKQKIKYQTICKQSAYRSDESPLFNSLNESDKLDRLRVIKWNICYSVRL